ncbi:unnamed protein product [Ranitomeya imitator]|uniref:Reverse transcriptase domain-containing protein n=1 Tax=Ranitomeya imitator TaxID=111125 RepID=A0ABN9L6D8_9NEOB|nr:unnamed protein product [Ranitomeya imitator]
MEEALLPDFPVVPTFYILPKVHKDPRCPPGRPIVSGIGGLCEPACRFVDFYLQRCVESLPSFVKDTTDVLRRFDGLTLEDDMWLVTCDVESLYTSIDHSHGMRAAQFFLNMTNLSTELIQFILNLLQFIPTHNYFVFKDRPFLQLQGTAMGASCAPSYANLFLGLWERDTVLDTPGHGSVILWLRYIDDVLFIWQGSTSQLEQFLNLLNVNTLNIKLTWKFSQTNIDFLDLQITKSEDGTVCTVIFRKTTATNALLHFASSHPPKLKSSIPTGQFLRARRICSDDDIFHRQAKDLERRFKNRGYPSKDIARGYSRALKEDRSNLLARPPKKHTSSTDSCPRFITKFNSNWREINQIFRKHWPVLLTDKDLQHQLTPYPSITWRKSQTLSDALCSSHYIPPRDNPFSKNSKGPPWGCFPCGNCSACHNIIRTKEFLNAKGDKTFKIVHHITCNTEAVIYHMSCPCGLIYIGMTTRPFKIRIQEHVRDIKNAAKCADPQLLKTVPKHFLDAHKCNPKGLTVRGIDRVYSGAKKYLVSQQ